MGPGMGDMANPFHHRAVKKGILLVQLGTPDAPTPKAIRRFLKAFLSDKRVIGLPRILWYPILYGIILVIRPRKLSKVYQEIWDHGSPLSNISEEMVAALQKRYENKALVKLAMRYGKPDIPQMMKTFQEQGIDDLCILPMYPQYSATTTASVFDDVMASLTQMSYIPSIRWINGYADNPVYIELICASIRRHWEEHGRAQRLLISFHGLPANSRKKGDPYACFCEKTTRLIRETLDLTADDAPMVYQSRFGFAKWLSPYCDQAIQELGAQGVKTMDVVCPGFSVDCLETLEEMKIRNHALFMASGGESLRLIPCLNTNGVPVFIPYIEKFILESKAD